MDLLPDFLCFSPTKQIWEITVSERRYLEEDSMKFLGAIRFQWQIWRGKAVQYVSKEEETVNRRVLDSPIHHVDIFLKREKLDINPNNSLPPPTYLLLIEKQYSRFLKFQSFKKESYLQTLKVMPIATIRKTTMKTTINPVAATAVPIDRVVSEASSSPKTILLLELVLPVPTLTFVVSRSTFDIVTGWKNSISWINDVCSGAVVLIKVPGGTSSSVGSLLVITRRNVKSSSS